MKWCNECNSERPIHNNYCIICGEKLVERKGVVCPECGAGCTEEANYCGLCGTRVRDDK